MPTLLLCGHGYLGQAIAREFLTADWSVTAVSRSGDDGSLACDLSSADDVASLDGQPDFIVHCASSGRGGAEAYRGVYLDGCRHLLDRFPGVTHAACMDAMHVVDTDGRVYAGPEAFVRVLVHRRPIGLAAYVYYVPGLRWCFDLGYRVIAANRYRLAKDKCEDGSCAVHFKH